MAADAIVKAVFEIRLPAQPMQRENVLLNLPYRFLKMPSDIYSDVGWYLWG